MGGAGQEGGIRAWGACLSNGAYLRGCAFIGLCIWVAESAVGRIRASQLKIRRRSAELRLPVWTVSLLQSGGPPGSTGPHPTRPHLTHLRFANPAHVCVFMQTLSQSG